jgi:hypothetical protein
VAQLTGGGYVVCEAAAGRGRGARGWRAVAASHGSVVAWHDRMGLGQVQPQLARGKTKYKNVECK